jgi:hypothetical protein
VSIELPAAAKRLLAGSAPEALRRGLAAGAVPLPPLDLVSALAVMVARESDEGLRDQARETLRNLPSNIRKAALEAPLAPPVFRVVWTQVPLPADERTALVLNADAPDEVIADLVEKESETHIAEIVAGNQTRMLRHVPIVEALLESPVLGPAAKARIEEFFARAYAGKVLLESGRRSQEDLVAEGEWDADLLAAVAAAAKPAGGAAPEDDVPEDLLVAAEEEEAALSEEQAEALIALVDPELAAELAADAAVAEDASEDAPEAKKGSIPNVRKMVATMTVGQKIKLALLGTKEARALLIFDANKVVSSLVLKNPMLSESEAIAIAKSKSVRDDILRGISRDKKFMKSYAVKHALVSNPKTPVPLALALLSQMRDSDVKKFAKSKSVGAAVSAQAKRMLMKKGS